jgi:peptidoglycan DL-endopeptidase CwlO
VASPRHPSRFPRILAVLIVSVATVGLTPGSGNAVPQPPAPQTCAESRAQFVENGEEAEKLAEKYNDARVALRKVQKDFRVVDARARSLQKTYATLAAQFKQLVAGEVKSAPAGEFALVFASTSAQNFVDQLSIMQYVAGRKARKILQVAQVRATAMKAQAAVQTKLNEQKKIERDIRAKKGLLYSRGKQLASLLQRLCGQEQAARAARASRSTSRTPVTIGGAPSAAARKAVQVALAQRGDGYAWGAAGPNYFDCSGLTMYAWAAAGRSLPHSSGSQYGVGTHVSRSQVQAGDLVFFYSPIHHVGIAINNSQFVHAPTYGEVVQVATIDQYPYTGATRVG